MSDIEQRVQKIEGHVSDLLDWTHQADVREAGRHHDMLALQREVSVMRTSVKDRIDRQDDSAEEHFRDFAKRVDGRFAQVDKSLEGIKSQISKGVWGLVMVVVAAVISLSLEQLFG